MGSVSGLSAKQLDRVRGRLEAIAAEMFEPMVRKDQRRWGEAYVRGLMLDGKRKSIEPMAARLEDEQHLELPRRQHLLTCSKPMLTSPDHTEVRELRVAVPTDVLAAPLLVEPDADAITRALTSILESRDLRARLAEAGRERAHEFSWDRTARGWLEVLNRAASRS